MSEPNDGGAAFPVTVYGMDERKGRYMPYDQTDGMSLRDYFAGQTLAGLLAHVNNWQVEADLIAQWSYQQADAMLKARQEAK